MAKKNDEFFVAAYQSHTAKIADIKRRNWLFLLALAGNHFFALSAEFDNQMFFTNVTIGLFLHVALIRGLYSLYGVRSKLKEYNVILRSSDERLRNVITEDPTIWDFGDLIMCVAVLFAAPVSMILLWGASMILPIALYLIAVGICVKCRHGLSRALFG